MNRTGGRPHLRWSAVAILLATTFFTSPASSANALMTGDVFRPESPSGAYLAGRVAMADSDFVNAARFMEQALENDPANLALIDATFNLMVRAGRVDAATDLARRLLEVRPDDRLGGTIMLLEAVQSEAFDEALSIGSGIEFAHVETFVMPLVEAWLHAGLGDLGSAESTLVSYGESTGLVALAEFHQGLILDRAGQLDRALEAYLRAQELGESLRLVMALGSLYERRGEDGKARDLYRRYAEENPGSVMIEPVLAGVGAGQTPPPLVQSAPEGIAEALFQIASALYAEGAPEYALVYGRLAQFLRPNFALGQVLLGDVLADLEQDESALALYRSVSDDSPASWTARLKLGRALQRLDQIEQALTLLHAMAEERPDRGEPLITVGDIHRSEQRFTEAVSAYDSAFDRAPDMVEADWTFYYRRGIALERARLWDRAETDLEQALSLNPDHAHLLNYLGYSWIDRGLNVEEAERLIRRAVELRPDDGYIVDSLGWVYFRTGRLTEAVQWLERAVELRPQDAVINDHLGDAYWVVGRRAEARFQWERARNAIDETDDPELLEAIEAKLERGLIDPPFLDDVIIETNASVELEPENGVDPF